MPKANLSTVFTNFKNAVEESEKTAEELRGLIRARESAQYSEDEEKAFKTAYNDAYKKLRKETTGIFKKHKALKERATEDADTTTAFNEFLRANPNIYYVQNSQGSRAVNVFGGVSESESGLLEAPLNFDEFGASAVQYETDHPPPAKKTTAAGSGAGSAGAGSGSGGAGAGAGERDDDTRERREATTEGRGTAADVDTETDEQIMSPRKRRIEGRGTATETATETASDDSTDDDEFKDADGSQRLEDMQYIARVEMLQSAGINDETNNARAKEKRKAYEDKGEPLSDDDINYYKNNDDDRDAVAYLGTLYRYLRDQAVPNEFPDRNDVDPLTAEYTSPDHQAIHYNLTETIAQFDQGTQINRLTPDNEVIKNTGIQFGYYGSVQAQGQGDDDDEEEKAEENEDAQAQQALLAGTQRAQSLPPPPPPPTPATQGERNPRDIVRGDLSRSAPSPMMQQAQSTMQQGADGAEEMRVASMKLKEVKERIRALHTAYAGMLPEFETPEHKANRDEALKATDKNAEKARLHLIGMFKSIRAYFAGGSNIPGGLQVGIVIPAQDYLRALMGGGGGGGGGGAGCGCKHDDEPPTNQTAPMNTADDPETTMYDPPGTRAPMGTSTKGKPHPGDILKDRHGRDSFGHTYAVSNHYRNSGVDRGRGVAGYQAPTIRYQKFSKPRDPPTDFPNMTRDAIRFHRRPKGLVPGLKINTTKM